MIMEKYLSSEEAAKFLGIKLLTLRNSKPWKYIPKIKQGNRVYYSIDVLNKYIQDISKRKVRYKLLLTCEELRILRGLTEGFPVLHNKLSNPEKMRIKCPENYYSTPV